MDIPDNGIESISKTCHQLKHLNLQRVHFTGIDMLLKTSTELLTLQLQPHSSTNAFILGDILEILGLIVHYYKFVIY